jgi:hypothetical protein
MKWEAKKRRGQLIQGELLKIPPSEGKQHGAPEAEKAKRANLL